MKLQYLSISFLLATLFVFQQGYAQVQTRRLDNDGPTHGAVLEVQVNATGTHAVFTQELLDGEDVIGQELYAVEVLGELPAAPLHAPLEPGETIGEFVINPSGTEVAYTVLNTGSSSGPIFLVDIFADKAPQLIGEGNRLEYSPKGKHLLFRSPRVRVYSITQEVSFELPEAAGAWQRLLREHAFTSDESYLIYTGGGVSVVDLNNFSRAAQFPEARSLLLLSDDITLVLMSAGAIDIVALDTFTPTSIPYDGRDTYLVGEGPQGKVITNFSGTIYELVELSTGASTFLSEGSAISPWQETYKRFDYVIAGRATAQFSVHSSRRTAPIGCTIVSLDGQRRKVFDGADLISPWRDPGYAAFIRGEEYYSGESTFGAYTRLVRGVPPVIVNPAPEKYDFAFPSPQGHRFVFYNYARTEFAVGPGLGGSSEQIVTPKRLGRRYYYWAGNTLLVQDYNLTAETPIEDWPNISSSPNVVTYNAAGLTFELAVTATGPTPLRYQWEYKPRPEWDEPFVPLESSPNISGVDQPQLIIKNAARLAGYYRCKVSGTTKFAYSLVEPAFGPLGTHHGDTNGNLLIDLPELLTIIQFYNVGAYSCAPQGGFAAGAGNQECTPHNFDYQAPTWQITLRELLRAIQFFNSDGYIECDTEPDGYCLFFER